MQAGGAPIDKPVSAEEAKTAIRDILNRHEVERGCERILRYIIKNDAEAAMFAPETLNRLATIRRYKRAGNCLDSESLFLLALVESAIGFVCQRFGGEE